MEVRSFLAEVAPAREEFVETLAAGQGVRIERIVSHGHTTPFDHWYDQEWDEFVLLVRGAARLLFADDGSTVAMASGDSLVIAAHRRHQVVWTSPDEPTYWLAVHYTSAASQRRESQVDHLHDGKQSP